MPVLYLIINLSSAAPVLISVPSGVLADCQQLEQRVMLSVPGVPLWEDLGPGPQFGGQARVPDGVVSGAVASIAAGQALFSTHCVSCHGPQGKGDGPIGVTLNPQPADLSQHAIPGVHADAQLFEWITNGFPGSRMPAFRTALSDTDRWHLVNFIRTFAPK